MDGRTEAPNVLLIESGGFTLLDERVYPDECHPGAKRCIVFGRDSFSLNSNQIEM